MLKAFKYRLYPSKSQKKLLESTFETCRRFYKAFQAFFRRVKDGENPGYPRFKGRNRFDSFGLKEYGNGFRLDGRRLKLSGIGRIAVRWHRPVEGEVHIEDLFRLRYNFCTSHPR